MLTSLKELIETRLESLIVDDNFFDEKSYFIKINKENLQILLFFLKNDPDLRLSLFEQLLAINGSILPWSKFTDEKSLELLYQLKSIKLPYRVTVCIELENINEPVLSVTKIFPGAKWCEEDLQKKYGINFELES